MSISALSVSRVTRAYGGRQAVSDASLNLKPGTITCLLGPSGCGKSSLLRLIAGLEPVDTGAIAVDGRLVSSDRVHVAPERRGVGLVFQDFALFPHLDVSGNIGFGLRGLSPPERRAEVASLLARFQLEPLARAWPHTLSGGEQQRVAIARALARKPSILLLDEPFSGLDGRLRASVRRSVLEYLRAAEATVLIVTHDPEEAMLIGDELLLMSGGRILQSGTPRACYLRPVSRAAAELLGDVVTLPARIKDGVAHTCLGPVPARASSDGPGLALTRPEHLLIAAGGVDAVVVAVQFSGADHIVALRIGGQQITARLSGSPPEPGAVVGLSLDADLTIILPDEDALSQVKS